MIGQYKVMDAHCHVYPATIAAKAVAGTDAFYGVKSVYDGTVETLLDRKLPPAWIILSSSRWPPPPNR